MEDLPNSQCIELAKQHFTFDHNLKQEQIQCLDACLDSRDVLAVLPTGFGKSLIFQLAPFAVSVKQGIPLDKTTKCVLVLTPLNSIMVDQCTSLAVRGISACALDYSGSKGEIFVQDPEDAEDCEHDEDRQNLDTSVSLHDIRRGAYQIIYAHPEALISSSAGQALLRNKDFKKNLACIAIDEAHMIIEWQVSSFIKID